MKPILIMFISGLTVVACVKTDKSLTPEDPNWIRLEAPTGGEAMDVAGNIDSTLFVATMFEIYKTANRGKSWDLIRSSRIGPQGLYLKKDTLWLLTQRFGDSKTGGRFAEYTVDNGKTWQRYASSVELTRQINRVQATDGSIYSVKENVTPYTPGNSSGYVNPSDLVKEVGAVQQQVRFPFKHRISSLLLDSKDRLYVAVAGTHIAETNRIYCCPSELPSVVYVSRNPLP